MIKTLIRNVLSNYVGIAGAIIIAFVMSPFLVHSLGNTQYGIWSIISALTGYMALLDLGVSSAMAKYVARYKALNDYRSVNKFIAAGILIMICVGSLLVAISPLLASAVVHFFSFDGELAEAVRLLVIIGCFDICIFVISGAIVGSFFGFQRYEIINGVNLSAATVKALLMYLALSNGYSLVAMGVISLLCNLLSGFLLFSTLRKIEPDVRINLKEADRSTVNKVFDFSRFTFLSMVALQIVYYSDAFVIGYFLSAAAITFYAIPWSLSEYTNKLIMAIGQTFVPVFSEQDAKENSEETYLTYLTGTKVMLFVSNLLSVGVITSGYYFIDIWMGPEYAKSCTTLLIIMFFTQMIKGPQLLSYSILLAKSSHKLFSYYNIGFSLLNLALSIILVQKYGLVGVAVATAITQITFYGIVTPILTRQVLKFSLRHYCRETYFRSLPSALVLYVSLKFLNDSAPPDGYIPLLSQAGLATLLYTTLAYGTLLNTDERKFVANKARERVMRFREVRT